MKASVSLITYNQEKFIEEAIQSALNQITNFEYEIVVSDDCSTDSTAEIIQEITNKFPEKIKFIRRKTNLGVVKNFIETIKSCKGEFISLLEGDDYWNDNTKLQNQVKFLENHPECTFCFTRARTYYEGNNNIGKVFPKGKIPVTFNLDYYLENSIKIPNNTKVFRRSAQPDNLPIWFFEFSFPDWILHILHARSGKIGFVDMISLSYRKHPNSTTALNNSIERMLKGIKSSSILDEYLNFEYHKYLKDNSWEFENIAILKLKQKDYKNFFKYLIILCWKFPFKAIRRSKEIMIRIKHH